MAKKTPASDDGLSLFDDPTPIPRPAPLPPPAAPPVAGPPPPQAAPPASVSQGRPPAAPSAEPRLGPPPAAPRTAMSVGIRVPVAPISYAKIVVENLRSRGHKLLTKEGRLYVSESSRLTAEERDTIRSHKFDLLPLAEPWPDGCEVKMRTTPWTPPPLPSVARVEVGNVTSLAQMLGHASHVEWKAEWPPDALDDERELIFNFETNGLQWYNGHRPIGFTVGTLDGQRRWFMPFGFKGGGNLPEDKVKERAKNLLRGKRLTNTHTSFDCHMSREWGVDLEELGCEVSDIQHYAALLDDHRKRFALDVLAKDYGVPMEILRVDESQMDEYAASQVAPRAEYQTTLVAQLREKMWPLLDKENLQRVRQLEDEVIFATVEMEKNGAPIDLELMDDYGKRCRRKHQDLLWEIAKECGFAFDHTNPTWQRLFEYCKIPITRTKKKEGEKDSKDDGKPSFADAVITHASGLHPLIAKGQLASQYASLDSKVFSAYPKLIGADGILRFDINQLRGDDGGTVSGRFSIGWVQQVPNKGNHTAVFGDDLFPRRLYIPGKGYRYVASDAEQIEYRIFASLAQNQKVLEAYRKDPRASFHRMIMAMILPYKADMVYENLKSLNFMKLYGGRLVKIALMMGFITPDEADEIYERRTQKTDPRLVQAREIEAIYNRELPEVDPMIQWASHLAMSKCNKFCRPGDPLHTRAQHQGYVETILGRRSRFPNEYKLYIALNRIIQGDAAEVNKRKLVELRKRRKETHALLRMTVHDEVCHSVPEEVLEPSLAIIDETLNYQSFPEFVVPILWKTEHGNNWAECK